MKAEINNENKARFYGANWGNTVVIDGSRLDLNSIDYDGWLEDSYLELKTLSDISDEDAIEAAKILGWKVPFFNYRKIVHDSLTINVLRYPFETCSFVLDFLRDRGYLVPWMGLSCEEMIEAGWAKYKE